MGGFATSSSTVWPAMIMVPPIGNQSKGHEGGHENEEGRQFEHHDVGLARDEVLLQNQLESVGQGLEQSEGTPTLCPMRLCMSEINLRSNQIIKMTEVIRSEKARNTFKITITQTANVTPCTNSGSAEASQLTSCPIEPG